VISTEHETGQVYVVQKLAFYRNFGMEAFLSGVLLLSVFRVRSGFYIQLSVETGTRCVICRSQILSSPLLS